MFRPAGLLAFIRQAAADPALTDPAPTDPAPTDPGPSDPAPVNQAPTGSSRRRWPGSLTWCRLTTGCTAYCGGTR